MDTKTQIATILICLFALVAGMYIGSQQGYSDGAIDGAYIFCLDAPDENPDFYEFDVETCQDLVSQLKQASFEKTPVAWYESR